MIGAGKLMSLNIFADLMSALSLSRKSVSSKGSRLWRDSEERAREKERGSKLHSLNNVLRTKGQPIIAFLLIRRMPFSERSLLPRSFLSLIDPLWQQFDGLHILEAYKIHAHAMTSYTLYILWSRQGLK